ncbi:acrylyl-CoA reductase family protein [Paenibacillus senegalensis]|uniref:acrylyl-CoA reductase family protein n=1 Tax=Paenibacillus senegalensis TaxID=1465766 RepID=UPI0002892807|nr:acryloyl-CoA reductase [Paenibacillus senegalensis]
MNRTFQALWIDKPAVGSDTRHSDTSPLLPLKLRSLTVDELPEGEVLVEVHYSCVNYKDALAAMPDGQVVRQYPIIPGIDLSGVVISSSDPRYVPGDSVLATGYELGVAHYGGLSEYARVKGDWLVPLPQGLSLREAMIYGTAGFTAALSLHRLEENGAEPKRGPVLVTGATGGVGSVAVALLAAKGYSVTASTGKAEERDYLRQLGAQDVISREQVYPDPIKPLAKTRWQAAVDPVGGKALSAILSQLQPNGSVAVSGLTGGSEWQATVLPFILRGINLLGIDSVYCPSSTRKQIWQRLAADLKPSSLEAIVDREISLEEVPAALERILRGGMRGRVIVRLK